MMKTLLIKLSPILVLLVLLCPQSRARETDQIPRNWLQEADKAPPNWLSVGVFFLGGEKPFFSSFPEAANISYHYQVNAHLFSLRGLWTGSICIACADSDDNTEFWDVSLLYGRSTASDYFHASISAGLGITGGDRADTFDEQRTAATTIGAAFQVQLLLPLSSSFGIGIYSFANINPEAQFYGVTLNLQFGKLR